MDTNKPMALRLANKYEHEGFLSDHKFAQNQWCSHAAVELRRLQAENETLQACYDAARLEIESLQSRLIHANEQHRLWFSRSQELENQLDAVGAGGVEPLRKRECLHQIIEPAPSEWDVRGHLAASLTCWPRLTGQEAAELVELFQGARVTGGARCGCDNRRRVCKAER